MIKRQNSSKLSPKHKFAFFVEDLSKIENSIKDKELVKRISLVLRLKTEDEIVLFDRKISLDCEIISISKDKIEIKINKKFKIESIKPEINIFIGLLKKESFEEILYSCVELGATSITPLITEKIHKNWWSNKFKERFDKILISAAEQSKNFFIPELNEPIKLSQLGSYFPTTHEVAPDKRYTRSDEALAKSDQYDRGPLISSDSVGIVSRNVITILLDVNGQSLFSTFNQVKDKSTFNLIIGPEGDFSDSEKELMKKNNFTFCKLTPTVLRSIQALNVGLGSFRALFN